MGIVRKFFSIFKSKNDINEGYQNKDLINLVILKNKSIRNAGNLAALDVNSMRTIAAIGLAGRGKNKMEVLDFGGGAGHHQAVAKIVFPEIHFNWTVVETDELVQRAQGEIKDLGLDFISSLEKVRTVKFDLVFSNSAIQYLPNPLLELKKLVSLDFEYLFLTRIPLRRSGKSLRYIQSSKLSQNGPGPAPLNFKDAIIEYHASIVEKSLVEEILDTSLQSRVLIDEGDWDPSRFGKTVGIFSYLGKSK